MIDLLIIYKWSIFAGIFTGSALSLLGAQLSSRSESVQSFVLAQAAAVGIVMALMIELIFFPTHSHEVGLFPIVLGFLFASFIFFLFKNWKGSFKNTYFIAVYVILLSLKYILSALTPGIDAHITSSYIGDMALITTLEAQFISLISILILLFLWRRWTDITAMSFIKNTFDHYFYNEKKLKTEKLFLITTPLLITLSVELLGLLFTLSCLFIPMIVLSTKKIPLKNTRRLLILSSSLGVVLGVFLSFNFIKLPTVPSICLGVVFASYTLSRRYHG